MTKTLFKNNVVHLVILILTGIITCGYTYEKKVELLGDNANYYILAKSITQGEGYASISHPGNPKNNHYPPGYPVLISPILLISGDSIQAVKIFNCLLFLGSLILLYLITNKWLNSNMAFLVALFCAFNSHILFYSSIMMSEVPYLFFSLLTFWFFIHIRKQFTWKDKYIYFSLAALVITYYIRALGLALLIGILLHLLINKQWKLMIFFVVGLIAFAAPWSIRSASLGGSSYMNQLKMINPYQPSLGQADLSDFITRIGENIERYITKEIPSAFYPAIDAAYQEPAGAVSWFFGLLLVILGLVGFWLIKTWRYLLLGYLLATFGILMLWPQVWIGVRFIVPVIPLFYLGVGSVLAYLFYDKLKQPENDWKPYLLIIFILPLFRPIQQLHQDSYAPYHPAWNSYFTAAEWIRKNTSEGSVVSTGKPSLFYLYADRPTMRYQFTENEDELLKNLSENNVDYVIIDQVYGNTLRYLLPVVQNHRNKFELVHQVKNPDTFILKYNP